MKRVITLVLVFVLLLSTSGCEGFIDPLSRINDIVELLPTETPDVVVDPFSFSEPVGFGAVRQGSITEDKYYQKDFLSDNEKAVYDKIVETVKTGKRRVDISSYKCSKDAVQKTYRVVTADFPQFFYLSNQVATISVIGSEYVSEVLCLYFDGKNSDDTDEKGNVIEKADRNLIGENIKKFNKKVSEITDSISADLSDVEKEKTIYNYLQNNIVYNQEGASTEQITSNSYNSFGAICEGVAVCEGYAEAFQYLCYNVGINSTVVIGYGKSEPHKWNAVCIDSEWYMVDPTWDDSETEELNCYSYFNVTSEYIKSENHKIESDNLHVPECTSTKNAFYNVFGMSFKSMSENPVNYKSAVDYAVSAGEKYIHMYTENESDDFNDFIVDYILSPDSDLQKYIAQKGYKIKIDNNYMITTNYLCFKII